MHRYSKTAWILPYGEDAIYCQFPQLTRGHSYSCTVPTALCYNGHGKVASWGHGIPEVATPLRFFKYSMLHEDDWLPEARTWPVLADAVLARRSVQKKANDVMIDYMNQLWRAVQFGPLENVLQQANPDSCSLRFVVTYPSGWL
jgi:hypothetical protein